jgi:hypothetical protein
MFWRWYPKSCVMLVEALTFRAGPGRIAACGHRPCSSSTRQQLLPPPCPAKPTPPFRPLTHCTLSIGSHLKPQRAGLQERGSDARAVGLHVQKPQQRRQQGQVLGAHALRSPPRPFCVSIFLDKNRRCIWIATPPPPTRWQRALSVISSQAHSCDTGTAPRNGNSSQSGWQHTVNASQ